MKLFKSWMKKKKRRERREDRIANAAKLGYQISRMTGSGSHRYIVTAPDGTVLDNDELGFTSSSEAYTACVRHDRQQKGETAVGEPIEPAPIS